MNYQTFSRRSAGAPAATNACISAMVGVVALASAFFLHSCALQPGEVALGALETGNGVIVERAPDYIGFRPRFSAEPVRKGFIFYPGGLVDERAYSPLARAIAAEGFFVAIVPAPLKLAVFNPFAAYPVIRENRFVRTWAIGGHSLGGAMAARFVFEDSVACRGLVLYASYPDASNNLSRRNLPTLSISASLDGLATPETIEATKAFLPPPPLTRFVVLEGGNHAQFGDYGRQNRDNEATMSREEQQRRTVEETVRFLRAL
jgi:pimeloyl-ACP methyl ester carboxylesterase